MNYSQVRKIVNKHDPLHLLEIGCPKDEYDPEIKDILLSLKVKKADVSINHIVVDVFNKWFSKEIMLGYEKALQQIAIDLAKR